LSDLESFNIVSEKWTKHASMLKSKSGFGIVENNGLIYVIGGNDGEHILNSVEIFNTKTKQWTKMPAMLDCRD
jgi:hypothetical protein